MLKIELANIQNIFHIFVPIMTSTKVDQMIHFAKSDEHEKYVPVINFQISAIFGILKFIIRTKFVFY